MHRAKVHLGKCLKAKGISNCRAKVATYLGNFMQKLSKNLQNRRLAGQRVGPQAKLRRSSGISLAKDNNLPLCGTRPEGPGGAQPGLVP